TRNYRIMYDDRAITYEECPNTIRGFVKQRVRWSYGILQSLWKNRDSIRTSNNKFLKYFAVPNMLITYLLYMTMPIADIVFIIAMFYKQYIVLLFFLFFFMVDTMASVYAFALERESKKPL